MYILYNCHGRSNKMTAKTVKRATDMILLFLLIVLVVNAKLFMINEKQFLRRMFMFYCLKILHNNYRKSDAAWFGPMFQKWFLVKLSS